VQVSEDGLRFGNDKGMLLTFARCNKNGGIQEGNVPLWKVANVCNKRGERRGEERGEEKRGKEEKRGEERRRERRGVEKDGRKLTF
jgi:hypothetical protein